ncbi:MAG TPA: MATE family efflux transporter [Candidatus Mediterraneibacter stercorigallinarum]|uniref:MATE family efflux transporter n=1 Tax=Candidatus Mediterraneibacter stercorigallinarum TaxID=2838686 RepID=A0A9D2D9E4_9FIRM|nr:MATE family efflux transporter [Candidatus Mediterraneibacter stercorigallinarum]
MNSTALFIKTSPIKLFFLASIPGAVSMFASALYYTLDGIFVGHFLGETAFAALNLAMPFVIINFSLADLIGVGSAIPISISLGKEQKKEADNLFTCACLMIVAAGALIGAVMFAAAPLLIRLMGAEGNFAELAVQYLRVYALCSPVTTIIFAVDNYLRICGYIRGSLFVNLLMSVLSAVLEFLFLGVFRWGIWAAALATCSGMFICTVIAFVPFFREKAVLRFCRPHFTVSLVRQIITCGTPNFLNNIAGRITSILMNVILVRLGGEMAVSVYGILMFAEGLIQPLLYGMCDSLQPAVGYNWGAQKFSRVRAIEKCCFTASGILSLLSVVLMALFPEQLTRLFISGAGPDVTAMSVTAIRLFSLTYITRWFSFATQSYMLAIEKPLPASLISVSTALIFPVILIIALWPFGLTGIWLNFAGTSALAAVMSAVILTRLRAELSKPDAPNLPSI